MPQAHAEVRPPLGDGELTDGGDFGSEPRMQLMLPDIHGSTHYDERVIALEIARDALPLI